jgi:hypothetical protein
MGYTHYLAKLMANLRSPPSHVHVLGAVYTARYRRG